MAWLLKSGLAKTEPARPVLTVIMAAGKDAFFLHVQKSMQKRKIKMRMGDPAFCKLLCLLLVTASKMLMRTASCELENVSIHFPPHHTHDWPLHCLCEARPL